jgi:hypothetical protein
MRGEDELWPSCFPYPSRAYAAARFAAALVAIGPPRTPSPPPLTPEVLLLVFLYSLFPDKPHSPDLPAPQLALSERVPDHIDSQSQPLGHVLHRSHTHPLAPNTAVWYNDTTSHDMMQGGGEGMQYHALRDDEKTPVHLDAIPENADWSKRHWDLGPARKIEWVLNNVIANGAKGPGAVQERLDAFMNTPAGRGMPQEHRARLRRLGWRVS